MFAYWNIGISRHWNIAIYMRVGPRLGRKLMVWPQAIGRRKKRLTDLTVLYLSWYNIFCLKDNFNIISFENNQKIIFVKIEVFGKISNFQIYMKICRKILLIYQTNFSVALISMHFIIESSYFKGWRRMHQQEKLNLKIFKKIQYKILSINWIKNKLSN